MAPEEHEPLLPDTHVEVFPIIQMIRNDIIHFIDTPLSYDALTAPDLTYTLVRPLFEKYVALQRAGNMSIVFCLLLNRVYFNRDKSIATSSLSKSRATLCEILAIRIFREESHSVLRLTFVLTTVWSVYSGADPNVLDAAREERDDDLEERVGNAIEMAILSKAKRFIKSSSCQKVIDNIWTGKCVYQAESTHSILSDTYKRTPIHFYDPHRAPLLDHYRLKVPAIRSVLEYMNFLILFLLFVVAIELNDVHHLNTPELLFMVYACGFTLEKAAAMQEHGIKVYFKGTWNGFDLAFVTTYWIYAILRVYGVTNDRVWARELGTDCLALIACLLFPRLAFVTLKNNLMVLSLRAMMMQFLVLMLIAAFCFCGFLYALWTLSRTQAQFTAGTIAWWMLDLWFGLDASGFDKSTEFHFIFGPILMVTYACLSNTLLLTILVSILSNTFAKINEDAAAEAMFRRAVSTIEGVKADSLFSYQPPINLFALFVMLPMSYVLSPRWFHKVNVFMIRLTSFPILLLIALYERQSKRSGTIGFYETIGAAIEKIYDTLPRQVKRFGFFEGLAGSGGDIDAIFEIQDEFETSALDTSEAGSPRGGAGFELTRQRRMSPFSAPTRSPLSPPHAPGSPPRARLNSQMARGLTVEGAAQNFTSPLAQIYQPLVIDADESDPFQSPPANSPPSNAVTYGLVHRRRMSSMHIRGVTDGHPYQHSNGSSSQQQLPLNQGAGRKFPAFESLPLSASPGAGSPPKSGPSSGLTAGQVKAEEEHGDDTSMTMERLRAIEERQVRIEEMLMKLVQGMESGKPDS
ncbi:hypothetical protein C8J56DRAFT_870326 [Mycena floridula]|nr:hypothetical protein C8J56DRAFT_870326 [Mycena floridula]